METDVLILGGGLSGLASAYEVASRGYEVTIVDEAWKLGGQLRHQTQVIDTMPAPFVGLRGVEIVEKLEKSLQKFSVRYLLQHEVIGLYADGSVGVSNGREIKKIISKSIIVATGAAEAALAFPGWTLPGVMTVGAAQILINRERVYPGKTGMIIGSSEMALEIATQLYDVGVTILGVVEPTEQIKAKDEKIVRSFQQKGIPLFLQTEVVLATGRGKVQEIILQSTNDHLEEKKYAVDFVGTDEGRQPILDVCSILDCQLGYQKELGGDLPCYGADFQSSVSGVFVAGQVAGITCHAGIFLTGGIAGIGAIDYLERGATEERKHSKQMYWQELERMETAKLPEAWQARMAHIKACSDTARS